MSYHIPFHIQVEIIRRLPVKSLLQFRSVSKPWKHLIDSSDFIVAYSHIQPERLLIWHEVPRHRGEYYVSFVDDETFAQEFVPTVKLHTDPIVVGCSHGLVCFYGAYRDRSETDMAILWNPSIRKSVGTYVPDKNHNTVLGFGVCPITSDPTIVKFTYFDKKMKSKDSVPWVVEVFTLSVGSWRTPSCNLPNVYEDYKEPGELVVYEPCSEHFRDIGIYEKH